MSKISFSNWRQDNTTGAIVIWSCRIILCCTFLLLSQPFDISAQDFSISGTVENVSSTRMDYKTNQLIFLAFFQYEQTPSGANENKGEGSLKCMGARRDLRRYSSLSVFAVVILSFVFYAGFLLVLARYRFTPFVIWILAPAFVSLIFAAILAYYENEQLVVNCSQLSRFRVEIFIWSLLFNGSIALLFFGLFSIGKFILKKYKTRNLS